MNEIKLCVNIDHIATLREARGIAYPDPLRGALLCEDSGAHGITVHLREDRRHIQDKDVIDLKDLVKGKYNLEMALSDEIIELAKKLKPEQVTLVPEKREELTTEGGLDVKGNFERIKAVTKEMQDSNILVSLFVEPDIETISLSKEAGADFIEIHTGTYCTAYDENADEGIENKKVKNELDRIFKAAQHAVNLEIGVNAGHGLNYKNLAPILKIPGLEELNIGHSIISESIFTGLPKAVEDMMSIIQSQ